MSGDEQQHEYQNEMQAEVLPDESTEEMSATSVSEAQDSGVEVPIVDDTAPETQVTVLDEQEHSETVSEESQQDAEDEALKRQIEDLTGQYMRIAADFDNFRKRTEREKSELAQRVKRETISELLPVIDSFERAKSHINPQTEEEISIQKSYQGVYKQLVDCLKRIGVAPMRAAGKVFDPNLHEAVMREPTDEFEEGAVMEELVNGYMLGDLVLRHAMVKVAAEPITSSEEQSPETAENQAVE
ncbi:MAG: nucleotide exchange factor GrpE [Thermosynechococcaceae cyanobacterium]